MTGHNEVLIVEDDEDMLEVLVALLQGAGYATRSAQNGRQALDAVATSMPALIVLDMLMPVMDGWQFAREFRAQYGDAAPIVVATAAEHAQSRGDEISAVGVLPKPFDVSDLLDLVARHIGPDHRSPEPAHGQF